MKEDTKAAMAKLQAKRLKSILRMYDEGKTTEDIANVLDLSRQRIHQICKAAGYTISRQSRYCGRHAQ
jgi:DNA-directed RNA polymerase specialized sigma subunit